MGLLSPVENYANIGPDILRSEIQQDMNEREFEHNIDYQAKTNLGLQKSLLSGGIQAQVSGALAAGLSPLSVVGDSVGSVSTNASTKGVDLKHNSSENSLAEITGLSNARLMNSQAKLNEIEANRLQHEDDGADVGLRNFAQGLIDSGTLSESDKQYWQSVVDNPSQYNVGDYKAQKNFQDVVVQRSDAVAKVYSNEFEKELNIAYLRGDVPKWMANIKRSEFFELSAKIAEIKAQTLLLDSNRDLNSVKSKELVAQINKLINEANSIYHSDNVQLWKDKDFEALSVKVGEIALDAAAKYVGFKGLSKSIRKADELPSNSNSVPRKGIDSYGRKALSSSKAKAWAAERQRQLNKSVLNPF